MCFDFTIICDTLIPTHTLHQKKILLVHILRLFIFFTWMDRSIDTYIHKIKSNFKKVNTQYCSNNNNNNNNQLFSFFLFFFWRSDRWRRKENSLSSFRLLSSNNSFSILFSSYSFYTIAITVPIELMVVFIHSEVWNLPFPR